MDWLSFLIVAGAAVGAGLYIQRLHRELEVRDMAGAAVTGMLVRYRLLFGSYSQEQLDEALEEKLAQAEESGSEAREEV